MVSLFIKCNLVLVFSNVVIVALYAVLARLWCKTLVLHIILILVYAISGSVWVTLMVLGKLKNSVAFFKLASPALIPFNLYLLGILVLANATSICGNDEASLALRIAISTVILPEFLFNLTMRHWANTLRRELEQKAGIPVPTYVLKVRESHPPTSRLAKPIPKQDDDLSKPELQPSPTLNNQVSNKTIQ